MEDKRVGLNGYKIRSYGDLLAVALLISLLLSVVAWGLKLEGELNDVRNDVNAVQARVADGILPRAEERIDGHARELSEHDRRIERIEDKMLENRDEN